MTEKRGNLVKLFYDFNTSALLEIKLNGSWYRVTSKRFRSFDGERKITAPTEQPGHGIESFQNIKFETIEYKGPVFVYGTNTEVPYKGTGKYIEPLEKIDYPTADKIDPMAAKRMKRESEL
jgi:hypothetical protein